MKIFRNKKRKIMDEKKINVEDGEQKDPVQNEETTDNTQSETENAEATEKMDADNQSADTDTADKAAEEEPEKDPLDVALEEVAALKDKYLRTVAEFDNYRKRTIKEKAELLLNGSEKAVLAILPVMDDIERALANAGKTDDPQVLKDGMDLIHQKFVKVLAGLGVKKIDTENADFNVDYHEAIAMLPGMGDDKKGKVIDCTETGYTLNDKVIRHAKVAVGQ